MFPTHPFHSRFTLQRPMLFLTPPSRITTFSPLTLQSVPTTIQARASQKRSRNRVSPATRQHRSATEHKWDRVQPNVVTTPPTKQTDKALTPEACPALVLNADFSPLSYMPLSLWPWQEVIKAVLMDRVTVVATYDGVGIRSPGMLFPLPSVISLKTYQKVATRKVAFTRFNVFMRDRFRCMYCGQKFVTSELTFDHVTPRCLGGKTNWENIVTACVWCNHKKGRKLLKDLKGMRLRTLPAEPSMAMLQANARMFPPRILHESWRDYVYWTEKMDLETDDTEDGHRK